MAPILLRKRGRERDKNGLHRAAGRGGHDKQKPYCPRPIALAPGEQWFLALAKHSITADWATNHQSRPRGEESSSAGRSWQCAGDGSSPPPSPTPRTRLVPWTIASAIVTASTRLRCRTIFLESTYVSKRFNMHLLFLGIEKATGATRARSERLIAGMKL